MNLTGRATLTILTFYAGQSPCQSAEHTANGIVFVVLSTELRSRKNGMYE